MKGRFFYGRENMHAIERPNLVFPMLGTGREGVQLATKGFIQFFGQENYDEFRRYGKAGGYIPKELSERVDREVYAKVAGYFGITRVRGSRLWHEAMNLANSSVEQARRTIFPEQDKRGTLTTNIAWSDNNPSTALQILTSPSRLYGEQCKYEQGRQLGIGLVAAEVISEEENGKLRKVLKKLNDFLEERLFIGKKGDPEIYRVFSYHMPITNILQRVSTEVPNLSDLGNIWVKELEFPVRKLILRDKATGIDTTVPVLYDPREKDRESGIIKAVQRSYRKSKLNINGGLIETSPYMSDKIGFRLALMTGGHAFRDSATAMLEELFKEFNGFIRIEEDDEVDVNNGNPDRIKFRRRNIFVEGLNRPIEMMIYTLEDWIQQEYEIGDYIEEKGMHNGLAHDLYKLMMVGDIAEYYWPERINHIPLRVAKRSASFEYANRLGRKQRIYPPLYAA